MVSKKKNPLFVWGWDIKTRLTGSLFVITLQAWWCQMVYNSWDRFFYPTLTLMVDSYFLTIADSQLKYQY